MNVRVGPSRFFGCSRTWGHKRRSLQCDEVAHVVILGGYPHFAGSGNAGPLLNPLFGSLFPEGSLSQCKFW